MIKTHKEVRGIKKVKATLINRITKDGTTFIKPTVPLGRTYYVYPDSMIEVTWDEMHPEVGAIKSTRRLSVIADPVEFGQQGGYIPVEILKFEEN